MFTLWGSDLSRVIPSASPRLEGYDDLDSIVAAIDNRGVSGIEGLWLMSETQALVSIEPAASGAVNGRGIHLYQIVLVSSPRKALRPGTVLGYLQPSGRAGAYEGRMYTGKYRSLLQRHRPFVFNLTDECHLTVKSVKSPFRFSLRHTFNFLFRGGVYLRNIDDESTDGFIKQYPLPEGKPMQPVYL